VVDGPGLAVVRIPNLTAGRVDLTDEKRVADPAVDLTGDMLAPDDLLIVRTNGSPELIGRAAVVQPGISASFASYLIRFKLDPAQVRAQWVRVMLATPTSRRVLEALAASSAGQYNLGLQKLNSVIIPCPSLRDQDRLLAKLEGDEWSNVSLTLSLEAARTRTAGLRRALLAAAFSGRLTGRSSVMEMVEERAGV
jgi:type I restriction enzyme S subunit